MGQYKSYRDAYLDREIAEIERELIAYKSEQSYSIRQIKSRVSRSPVQNSKIYNPNFGAYHEIRGKITFVGTNKNKLARGALDWTVQVSDSRLEGFDDGIVVLISPGEQLNVLEWYVYVTVMNVPVPFSSTPSNLPQTCSFTATFDVTANMSGSVLYEPI